MRRQPLFYALQVSFALGLVCLIVLLLVSVETLLLRLAVAALMAFTSAQLGFIGHDLGHRQVFTRARHNDWLMLFFNPLVGISPSWWLDAHNRHHSVPNDLQLDPHTTIPVLAFSEAQAEGKRGLARRLLRLQSYYFVPLLALSVVGTKLNAASFVLKGQAKYPVVETLGMVLHLVLYVALLLSVMPVLEAIIFAIVQHALTGLYFGLMFAPNHKGMAIFTADDRPDFLRSQVLTSRNIKPSALVDFLYGGLNYQIEHHLFPSMPRNQLKSARLIVRSFCEERGIAYYETSVFRSYAEVLGYLRKVAA